MYKFCGNCGTKLTPNCKFCVNCGALLEDYHEIQPDSFVGNEIDITSDENSSKICHFCKGKGFIICEDCKGRGNCYMCLGSGLCVWCSDRASCDYCQDSKICMICKGAGRCKTCEGKKTTECSHCGGTGSEMEDEKEPVTPKVIVENLLDRNI